METCLPQGLGVAYGASQYRSIGPRGQQFSIATAPWNQMNMRVKNPLSRRYPHVRTEIEPFDIRVFLADILSA